MKNKTLKIKIAGKEITADPSQSIPADIEITHDANKQSKTEQNLKEFCKSNDIDYNSLSLDEKIRIKNTYLFASFQVVKAFDIFKKSLSNHLTKTDVYKNIDKAIKYLNQIK